MKTLVLAAGLLLSACNSCNKPNPPVSPGQYVYDSLVDAGCTDPDPVNGPAAFTQDLATPGAPDWETCIADGGTPTSCNAPCGADSKKKKK